eukprot:3610643-Rhodomonas_salina.2
MSGANERRGDGRVPAEATNREAFRILYGFGISIERLEEMQRRAEVELVSGGSGGSVEVRAWSVAWRAAVAVRERSRAEAVSGSGTAGAEQKERRKIGNTRRSSVDDGSVACGGRKCGVYPVAMAACGWQGNDTCDDKDSKKTPTARMTA